MTLRALSSRELPVLREAAKCAVELLAMVEPLRPLPGPGSQHDLLLDRLVRSAALSTIDEVRCVFSLR